MEIEIVILILISLLTFSFGIQILTKKFTVDKRQFLLFTVIFSQFLWVITNLLTLTSYNTPFWNLFYTRSSFSMGALVSICFLFLILELTQTRIKFINILLIFIQSLWVIVSYSDLVILDVMPGDKSLTSIDGLLKNLYSISLSLTFLYSFGILTRSYQKSHDLNYKYQVKYILYGGILAFILTILSSLVIPILGIELRSLGPSSMMIFVFSTFYSISQHRFLKLNIAFGNVLLFAALALVPLAAFFLIYEINTYLWGSIYSLPAIILGFGQSVVFILFFQRSQLFLRNIFNNKINYDYIRTKNYIDNYEKNISKDMSHKSIFQKTVLLLDKTVGFLRYKIVELDNQTIKEIITKGDVHPKTHLLIPVLNWASKSKQRFVDLTDSYQVNKSHYDTLVEMSIETIFPIDKSRFFILFAKSDNQTYTSYEIEFLLRINQILGIALNRADQYKKEKDFNKTLKNKVREATKQLSKQNKIIQKKYEEEKDMIGILGHELRTPLTVAKNMNDLLKVKVEKMAETNNYDYNYIQEKVKKINDSLHREIGIVETALSTSRIDNNKVEALKEPVNVSETLTFVIEAHASMAQQKGLELIFIPPEFEIPVINSDNAKVQEIITNLVSNAIKYTFQGKVTVFVTKDSFFLYITVQDTGVGIPADQLDKLGEKFYRINQHLDSKRDIVRPGGTGLGLYVTKNYAKLLGGELKVESEVGKGSAFTISLPLDQSYISNTNGVSNQIKEETDLFVKLGLSTK